MGKLLTDGIIPEILKASALVMDTPFVNLFTQINRTHCLSIPLLEGTIIRVYKKGEKENHANYRPISLLSETGKLYAIYLSKKLSWVEDNVELTCQLAGLWEGKSNIRLL